MHPTLHPFRRFGLLSCLALVAATSAACGSSPSPDPTQETSMTVGYGHGPMEQAVVRMMRMRTEMIHALSEELGPQYWAPAANQDGADLAGCNDGVSQTVGLRSYTFRGTYPDSTWHTAASIVERIGRTYGFDVVNRTIDKPGNLDLTGLAPDGGSYNFAMATATVLTVRTGCYQWEKTPGPDAWQTIDPTP